MDFLKIAASLLTLLIGVFSVAFDFKRKVPSPEGGEKEALRPLGWMVLALMIIAGSFSLLSEIRDQQKETKEAEKQRAEAEAKHAELLSRSDTLRSAIDSTLSTSSRLRTAADALSTQQSQLLDSTRTIARTAEAVAASQQQSLGSLLQLEASEVETQRGITRNLYPLRPLSVYYTFSYRLRDAAFLQYTARLRRALDSLPAGNRLPGVDLRGVQGRERMTIVDGSPFLPSALINAQEANAQGILTVSQMIVEVRSAAEMTGGDAASMRMMAVAASSHSRHILQRRLENWDIGSVPMSIRVVVDFDAGTITQVVETYAMTLLGDGGTLLSLTDLPGRWLVLKPSVFGADEGVTLYGFTLRNGTYVSPHARFEQQYKFEGRLFTLAGETHPLYRPRSPTFYAPITNELLRIAD